MAAPVKKPAAGKAAKQRKRGMDSLYLISGNKVERKNRSCPKCGPGNFLAEHSNRRTCGKCGYTDFKK